MRNRPFLLFCDHSVPNRAPFLYNRRSKAINLSQINRRTRSCQISPNHAPRKGIPGGCGNTPCPKSIATPVKGLQPVAVFPVSYGKRSQVRQGRGIQGRAFWKALWGALFLEQRKAFGRSIFPRTAACGIAGGCSARIYCV